MATAAAAITAAASLLGTGATLYGQSMRDNSSGRVANEINARALEDARQNEIYQRLVAGMINQRSVAGQRDSQGSSLRYDPTTNEWISTLGDLPQRAQTAADQAGIERNTTDMRQAQIANALAQRRAMQAGPIADTAVRELQNFRPQSAEQLTALLSDQATNAARATFDPLRADTLRTFQRSGSAAAPVMAALGKTEYDSLKEGLLDAQIKGMTTVGGLNQTRRQGLEQSAANASTLATPQFQYPGLTPRTDDMAKAVATRASQGAAIPAYGMGGVNTAAGGVQSAADRFAKGQPTSMNTLETMGNTISSAFSNKELMGNLKTLFGGGGSGGLTPEMFEPSTDPMLNFGDRSRELEKNWASNNRSFG